MLHWLPELTRIVHGSYPTPDERPVSPVEQVCALADLTPARQRTLVMVATFASLRYGEVTALRRMDIDLASGAVSVRQARTGNATAVLAAIRNTVATARRLAGAVNIAAARRTAVLDPTAAIRLFTLAEIRTTVRCYAALTVKPPVTTLLRFFMRAESPEPSKLAPTKLDRTDLVQPYAVQSDLQPDARR